MGIDRIIAGYMLIFCILYLFFIFLENPIRRGLRHLFKRTYSVIPADRAATIRENKIKKENRKKERRKKKTTVGRIIEEADRNIMEAARNKKEGPVLIRFSMEFTRKKYLDDACEILKSRGYDVHLMEGKDWDIGFWLILIKF
ncbi:hypothetical protein 000TH008_82 [Bacillus phage 000TH008]|nr:hypothetical protein 000TH008_82 [Bacillus phage 000TH008]QQO40776.1 hypothetical protein 000TH009_82 [Bacillus phage 000TH009]